MAGGPYVNPTPPPPPPSAYNYTPPAISPSPPTHITVIVIVVPIVGFICLGLLAALLFVLFRRRRRRCQEEAKVDEVEDVEVKVTEHVRIVEGVVGEAEAGEASCGRDDYAMAEAGAAAVVLEDDVKVKGHVVRITEASASARE